MEDNSGAKQQVLYSSRQFQQIVAKIIQRVGAFGTYAFYSRKASALIAALEPPIVPAFALSSLTVQLLPLSVLSYLANTSSKTLLNMFLMLPSSHFEHFDIGCRESMARARFDF